jgi:O-antigen/teichoic acid export membrane protein
MLLGLPFFAAKLMFIQALNAFDRSLAIGWAEAVGLGAALGALYVLLPRLGIEGAAWALVVANVVALGAMAGSLNRQIGAPVLAMFRPTADDWAQASALLGRLRR